MRISITGVPGTGKTTISRLVGAALKMRVVHLTELAKKEGLLSGFDRSRACRIVDIEKLKKKLEAQDNVIFESHFAEQIPADRVIVLRLDPNDVKERLQSRRYPKKKSMENALVEALDFYTRIKGRRKFIEIDTTGLAPYEIVKKIVKAVKTRRGDTVDHSRWVLDHMEELERLKL